MNVATAFLAVMLTIEVVAPLTGIVLRVTKLASSEARKQATDLRAQFPYEKGT
jgi:hypothetical protein